jgi:hypothetical protein
LKRRGWAWTITVIITITIIVIQVVFNIMFRASFFGSMDAFLNSVIYQIIGFAVDGVILYYLYRPNVKAYFGKSRPSTAIQR